MTKSKKRELEKINKIVSLTCSRLYTYLSCCVIEMGIDINQIIKDIDDDYKSFVDIIEKYYSDFHCESEVKK